MPLKFNTYSISAITQAVQDVPKNQRDSIETYLLMNIDRSVPGNQALNTLLSSHFPGADLMINDSSQRAARRDLSDIAWQTMLLQVAADAAIDRPEGVARHIGILFRPEASLENQMFNGDLRLAIAEKDHHMLTEMYNDHISNLEPYDTADFQDLTDEELVGKFSQLYALYNVAQDAAQLLNPTKSNDLGANLSDESKDRLQKLANDMPLFMSLAFIRSEILESLIDALPSVPFASTVDAVLSNMLTAITIASTFFAIFIIYNSSHVSCDLLLIYTPKNGNSFLTCKKMSHFSYEMQKQKISCIYFPLRPACGRRHLGTPFHLP